jgi:hypothetical protein
MGRRGYADLRRSSSVDGSRPALPSDILSNGFGDQGHRDTGDAEKKDVHQFGDRFSCHPFLPRGDLSKVRHRDFFPCPLSKLVSM